MFDLKMLGAGVAVTVAVVMAPSSAQAINLTATTQAVNLTSTTNGIDYEVTTIDSNFATAILQLVNTPWWASSPLSEDLAGELNTQLPSLNPGDEGPYFAFAINDLNNDGIATVSAWNWDSSNLAPNFVELDVDNNDLFTSFTWAVGDEAAAAIPTPALLPAMLGMGASIVRKRKKQAEAAA